MTQTPKVEKKCHWLLKDAIGHQPDILSWEPTRHTLSDFVPVVESPYVEALETALKSARELITDWDKHVGIDGMSWNKYQDALAKVDL